MKNFLCNDNVIMGVSIEDEARFVRGDYAIHVKLESIDNDLGKFL